jgi:uncharacterized membrane protein YcaP (DUF421 family)
MVDILELHVPIHQTLIHASLIYVVVCVLIRVIPKRQAGNISPHDMVGAVIVGGLAVEGIAPPESSPADVIIMIAVILFLNFIFDWLGDRVPVLRRFLHEPPTCLIRNGRVFRQALRREMLTEEELMAALRKQGVDDISRIRVAYLETDGAISVVEAEGPARSPHRPS